MTENTYSCSLCGKIVNPVTQASGMCHTHKKYFCANCGCPKYNGKYHCQLSYITNPQWIFNLIKSQEKQIETNSL